jgi:hypothetical protein
LQKSRVKASHNFCCATLEILEYALSKSLKTRGLGAPRLRLLLGIQRGKRFVSRFYLLAIGFFLAALLLLVLRVPMQEHNCALFGMRFFFRLIPWTPLQQAAFHPQSQGAAAISAPRSFRFARQAGLSIFKCLWPLLEP